MEYQNCNVKITTTNWSRHVRSLKNLKNDPDQTIPPISRGRPKSKPSPNQPRKAETKRRTNKDVTRKELLEQAKEYNTKGYTKWNKQQLLAVLSKAKKLLFKKHDLLQLNKYHLTNIAKKIILKLI